MAPKEFILLFALPYCYAHSRVPVVLIDYQGVYKHTPIKANPFHEISTGYFTDILTDIIDRSDTVIIFAEENLSPEDLTLRDMQGSPYDNIRRHFKEGKVSFLPAVYKPYRVLTQNLPLSSSNFLNVTKAPNNVPDIFTRKFFYVFFKDIPDLHRAEKLRRHDDVMERIVSLVQGYEKGPVTAIYTGIHNPAENIEDELPEVRKADSSPLVLTVQSKNTMLSFTGLSMKTPMRQSLDYHAPLQAEEFSWGEVLTTRVTSADFVLEFHFVFSKETWLLDRVTMLEDGEEVGVTRMDVRVPWRRSFICASPLVIENNRDGSAIVIKEYQLEPFRHPRAAVVKRHVPDRDTVEVVDCGIVRSNVSCPGPGAQKSPETTTPSSSQRPVPSELHFNKYPHPTTSPNSSTEDLNHHRTPAATYEAPIVLVGDGTDEGDEIKKFFSEPVICCPYFTTGILMGLLVVSVLTSILLCGIYVLMSCCKSNDRFDQPQQLSLFDLPANT